MIELVVAHSGNSIMQSQRFVEFSCAIVVLLIQLNAGIRVNGLPSLSSRFIAMIALQIIDLDSL